jgi:hypothetical protein
MSHRLWFRLDDVLPIAEHAMACTRHRITRAEALATAPTRPALVWTGSPVQDILTSNGVPAWYGERGTDHAAEAHTWRHTPSGRYGTAYRDGYHTAYLPLDVASNEPPAIEVLRDARHSNRNWVTIDIDPADRHLIGPSRVRVVAHRDRLVPADATWVPASVTSTDVGDETYPALVPDGYTTDAGLELPRFDRPTAEKMIADLEDINACNVMPGEYPHLQWAGDALLLIEERDATHGSTYHEVDQAHPDEQGRYAIGAYGWSWQRSVNRAQAGNGQIPGAGPHGSTRDYARWTVADTAERDIAVHTTRTKADALAAARELNAVAPTDEYRPPE